MVMLDITLSFYTSFILVTTTGFIILIAKRDIERGTTLACASLVYAFYVMSQIAKLFSGLTLL